MESLYEYDSGSAAAQPALASSCTSNSDLTTWTCRLRDGIRFHDGADLDATDVVSSFAVHWDEDHPLREGRADQFEMFRRAFGGFLPSR
jgi:ABC-type transport system substrate-binding protein